MIVPVFFILRPDLIHIDGQASIPVARAFRPRHPRELRHQVAVRVWQAHRSHGSNAKSIGVAFLQGAAGSDPEITDGKLVPRLRLQIVRKPLIDQRFVVAQVPSEPRATPIAVTIRNTGVDRSPTLNSFTK